MTKQQRIAVGAGIVLLAYLLWEIDAVRRELEKINRVAAVIDKAGSKLGLI